MNPAKKVEIERVAEGEKPEVKSKTRTNNKKHVAKHGRTSTARNERFNERKGNQKQQEFYRDLDLKFNYPEKELETAYIKSASKFEMRPRAIPSNTRGLAIACTVFTTRCLRMYRINDFSLANAYRVALAQHAVIIQHCRGCLPTDISFADDTVSKQRFSKVNYDLVVQSLSDIPPWVFTILKNIGSVDVGVAKYVPVYVHTYHVPGGYRPTVSHKRRHGISAIYYLPRPQEVNFFNLGLVLDSLTDFNSPIEWRRLFRMYCPIPLIEWSGDLVTAVSADLVCPIGYVDYEILSSDIRLYGVFTTKVKEKGETIKGINLSHSGGLAQLVSSKIAKIGIKGHVLTGVGSANNIRFVGGHTFPEAAFFDAVASLHIECPAEDGDCKGIIYERFTRDGYFCKCNFSAVVGHFSKK